jgi:hypothetical protein
MFLSFAGTAWSREPLVIHQRDFPSKIGTRTTYAFTAAGANSQNEVVSTVIESIRLGDIILTKTVTSSRGNQQAPTWSAIGVDGVRFFQEGTTETPQVILPLPLKVGSTSIVEKGGESEHLHVRREETISVPAGTFPCLVCVWEKDGLPVRTWWLSPGVGFVKTKSANGFTNVLKALHEPDTTTQNTDSVVLAHFNTGTPTSQACPKAGLGSLGSGSEGISLCAVDTTDGAEDTAMSLRWSYHTKNETWVAGHIMLTGSWNEYYDLASYESISFYIKGFRPGRCSFSLQGIPIQDNDESWVNIPVSYKTNWQKRTINLNQKKLSKIDMKRIIKIGFGCLGRTGGDNVIWIDEITCHRKSARNQKQQRR